MDIPAEDLHEAQHVSDVDRVTIGQVRQTFIDALETLAKCQDSRFTFKLSCPDISSSAHVMIVETNVAELGVITENGGFSWAIYRNEESYKGSGSLETRDHLSYGRLSSPAPLKMCYKVLRVLSDKARAEGLIPDATGLVAKLHSTLNPGLSIYAGPAPSGP